MRAAATKGYEKDYFASYADASRAGKNCINVLRAVESLLLGKKMRFNDRFSRPMKRFWC